MKYLLRFVSLLIFTTLTALGSVSSQATRIAYTISALPQACPTAFQFNSTATVPDLLVLDGGAGNSATSPPVTLVLNSDYTVTGGGYNSQNQLQTGTVTIIAGGTNNVQVGDVITILRQVPFTQTTAFSSAGFISPLMIEAGLDKLTTEVQQVNDLVGLSLSFQKNEVLSPQLVLSARVNLLLGFNSVGALEFSSGGGGGGGPTYTAGAGLTLTANAFSVNAAQPGITSLGTLTGLTVSGTSNVAAVLETGVLSIDTGTASGATPPSAGIGNIQLAALDGSQSGIQSTSFGTTGGGMVLTGYYVGGTRAAPTATPANAVISDFAARGYDTNYISNTPGRFQIRAKNLWSVSDHSTKFFWWGTPTGSTTPATQMTLDATDGLVLGTGIKFSTLGELKMGFGIATAPINAYDSASGGLYTGYAAGAGIIRAVADNSGSYAPVSIQAGNGTQVGLFTNLGLQGDIGMGTPGHADFIDIAWLNNTGLRTTKTNAHLLINVKDYGAIGDGGTNDTTAVNAAIAAMTNWSTLYFPAGSYLVTPGGLTEFASLNHISVIGDGRSSQITNNATGSPGNFLVFHSSCDHVTIRDFAIIGSATARGSGIGIRMYAPYSLVSNIYVSGTSDFGIFVSNDASGYSENVTVVNCVSDHTLGDGFHFSACKDSTFANCIAYFTGDDGVGIGDDGAVGFPATRLEVVNFQSYQAGNNAGGGTHGSGIRIFDGAVDIHVLGGSIYQSCEAGLQCTRATSTTAYNTRIKVDGLKVYQCLQTAGMYANISFAFVNSGSITNCWSEAPVSQGCYAFLDCNNLTVTGNTAKDAVVRSFLTDDGTTTNVAATWSNWTIMGNVCLGTPSGESYYFVPATGKAIANLIVTGNTETGQSTTNYIFTNRLATAAKINNNTSLGGKSVANGGSGISPTTANNN